MHSRTILDLIRQEAMYTPSEPFPHRTLLLPASPIAEPWPGCPWGYWTPSSATRCRIPPQTGRLFWSHPRSRCYLPAGATRHSTSATLLSLLYERIKLSLSSLLSKEMAGNLKILNLKYLKILGRSVDFQVFPVTGGGNFCVKFIRF